MLRTFLLVALPSAGPDPALLYNHGVHGVLPSVYGAYHHGLPHVVPVTYAVKPVVKTHLRFELAQPKFELDGLQ